MSSIINSPKKGKTKQKDSKKGQHDTQMDSGFMSGSNLLSSTSLTSESPLSLSSSSFHEKDDFHHPSTPEGYGKSGQYVSSDLLDSGVDLGLSARLSSIDITSDPLCDSKEEPPSEDVQEATTSSSCPPSSTKEGKSRLEQMGLSPDHITILKEIYRKDDDGDT